MNNLYLIDLDELREIYDKIQDNNEYKNIIFDIIKERDNLFRNGFSE